MYHPTVISDTIHRFETQFAFPLKEYTISEVEDYQSRLSTLYNDKGLQIRNYDPEESTFVQNELLMCKASFPYWTERYAFINKAGSALARMYPLWTSQKLILAEIATLEKAAFDGERNDGALIDLLKARQLGGSTISQCLQAHRTTTQNHVLGLIAADVPQQSAFLFDMFERIIENLPFYLLPKGSVIEHVKNTEMKFDGGSNIWVGSGKSIRGTVGERGQLGRGMTLSVIHLSELSTWEDTDQITAALMPTVHETPLILVIFESSGRGRNNYWHKHWNAAVAGRSRFTPVFIPWYAEETRYTRKAPTTWIPSDTTLAHARRCTETGPRWVHRSVHLNKDQLYWYESTRASHEADNELAAFLENYSAEPEEAFQFSGKSIFPVELLQRISDLQRPTLGVAEIGLNIDVQRGP